MCEGRSHHAGRDSGAAQGQGGTQVRVIYLYCGLLVEGVGVWERDAATTLVQTLALRRGSVWSLLVHILDAKM